MWMGLLLKIPGINATSNAAMKSMGCDEAVAAGMSRGEYAGAFANLRALTVAIAPLTYSRLYEFNARRGRPGRTWPMVAVVGALLPELLHQTLSTT